MVPENELGVIVLFAQQAQEAGYELISISSDFPDAVVRKDGIEYRAEFEYAAQNFKAHRHDIRACDIIVCWEGSYEECVLPILVLSDPGWRDVDLSLPSEFEREAAYWKDRALIAESQVKVLQAAKPENETYDWSNLYDLPDDSLTIPERARIILSQNPELTGSTLGEILGVTDGYGRKLKRDWMALHGNGSGHVPEREEQVI